MNLGLRTRLIGTVVGAILLFFIIVMVTVRATLSHDLNNLATSQVTAGADAFSASIASRIDATRSVLTQAAAQQNIIDGVAKHDAPALKEIVQGLAQPNGYSWVTIVDKNGKVIARANGLDAGAVNAPMVQSALKSSIVGGVTVLDAATLRDEYMAQDAAPLTSAPAIAAAAPISKDGKLIGAIYGGTMIAGESKIVDGVSKFTGGTAAVLMGDKFAASSIERKDGSRMMNTPVSNASGVVNGQKPYTGLDVENGTNYFAQIAPLKDTAGATIGALWFGIPIDQINAIQNHATNSVIVWALLGLLVAIAAAVFLADRVSRSIEERSRQVTESAKALGVLVVGSEVSNDHVVQTRAKLETVEELINRVVPSSVNGDGTKLRTLASEATSDLIVIDTLATEINDRMRDAVTRVAELNDVASGLNRLVHGSAN